MVRRLNWKWNMLNQSTSFKYQLIFLICTGNNEGTGYQDIVYLIKCIWDWCGKVIIILYTFVFIGTVL